MANREIISKVTNAVLYSDGLIRIDNVRASYPHLDKPWSGEEGQEAKFSIVSLLDKGTHKAAKDLIVKRINEILKENKTEKIASDKKFIRDGDQMAKPECENQWVVSARETRRPSVRGSDNEVLTPDEILDTIYAGCYISVLIRPWFQNHAKFGKRVNAGLVAVRFRRDGEPIGEGRITDDDIDDYMDDDYDDHGGSSSADDDDDL
jgi:hypothetical protein